MKKDYYEILGLPKDATVQQIKKKYRSCALKYHPDRVPENQKKESEEKFKEISEAYGVLSDPKKRSLYDQYGHAGIDQNFTTDDIFRGADFSSVFGDSGLGDVFSQFFGGGGGFGDIFGSGGQRVQRGRDIQYEVDLTLEEAYSGIEKKIKVPRNEHCTHCNGSGSKPGSKLKTCETCGGKGQVIMSSGFFRMQQACTACGGHGNIIVEKCPECNGRTMVKVTRKIDVNIPAGVDNNSRLRVSGQGEVGRDGAGDLYVYIHVLDHNVFKRDGNDIFIELPVPFTVAALGGEVSTPTLGGKVTMKIPAGTQSGKVFRLKDKGMPDLRRGFYGDQMAKVMISVPERISEEQKKLLEELAQLGGETINKKSQTIKEKIKKVFK